MSGYPPSSMYGQGMPPSGMMMSQPQMMPPQPHSGGPPMMIPTSIMSTQPMHMMSVSQHPMMTNPNQPNVVTQAPSQQPPQVIMQQQMAPPQPAEPHVLGADPLLVVRALVAQDLKQAMTVLFKVAADTIRVNAKTMMSANANDEDEQKSPEKQPTLTNEQFQAALDKFYEVCDQIELQFMLILECNKETKLIAKYLPVEVRDDLSGQPPSGVVTYNHFVSMAQQHVKLAQQIQKSFENLVNNLSDKEQENESSENLTQSSPIKMEINSVEIND